MKLSALPIFDVLRTHQLRLTAALTPQKKTLLMDRYHVTEEQMAIVEAADPTPNSTYAEWIVQRWARGNQMDLPHDAEGPRGLKAYLSKFNRDKNKTAWRTLTTPNFPTGLSNNIQEYSYQTLQASVDAFKDPNEVSIPEVNAPIIYEGQGAVLWKVPKGDWESLNELGKAGKAGWCTAQPDPRYAKHYITTGPIYVCYMDGKPYFQYMPGGPCNCKPLQSECPLHKCPSGHENPQFMDRFNTAFMKTTMMDEKAHSILKAVPDEPDLVKVTEQFSPPDMTEAATLKYLSEVLNLDKEYWRRSPEFREKELLFVKNRYPHLDPDELTALITKYPRTGELVKGFIDENPNVKKINDKLSTYQSMVEFKKDFFNKGEVNIVGIQGRGVFDEDEKALIVNLPPLFDKVFALYRKEPTINFDAKFAEMKALAAAKSPESLSIARTLVSNITSNFSGYSYRSGYTEGPGITYSGVDRAAGRFVDIIKSVVRPIIKGIYTQVEEELPNYPILKIHDLYQRLGAIKSSIQNTFPSDDNVNAIIKEKEADIKKKKCISFYEEIPQDTPVDQLLQKVRDLELTIGTVVGESELLRYIINTGCALTIGPHLKRGIDKIVAENAGDPIKIISGLLALKTAFLNDSSPHKKEVTDNAIISSFAKEAEPVIQQRFTELATKGGSSEELLTQATQVSSESLSLGIKSGPLYTQFLGTYVLPQITKDFNLIEEQQGTLSNTDYLAMAFNQASKLTSMSKNSNVDSTVATEFKRIAEETITEQFSSLTKLKHVQDQVKAWGAEDTGWIVDLAEARIKDIREGRSTRQVERDGAPRTRFAPKAEFENWKKDRRAWSDRARREQLEPTPENQTARGEKPTVSEKTETFIMTSPSVDKREVQDYFEFIDKISPAYQAWILSPEHINLQMAFEYLKNKVKTWPELGSILIETQNPSQSPLEEYREFIYKNSIWPEYEAKIISLDLTPRNRGHYNLGLKVSYSIEMKKGHWAPLDAALKALVTSPDWQAVVRGYEFGHYWKNAIMNYVTACGRLSDKETERILCSIPSFGLEYLQALIPADRIGELLDKFNEKKEAGKRNLISVLLRELEK